MSMCSLPAGQSVTQGLHVHNTPIKCCPLRRYKSVSEMLRLHEILKKLSLHTLFPLSKMDFVTNVNEIYSSCSKLKGFEFACSYFQSTSVAYFLN